MPLSLETDSQVEEMRRFVLGSLRASGSVFYWINENLGMTGEQVTGPCQRNFDAYRRSMRLFDPLNIPRLVASGKRVATLRQDHMLAPHSDFERYQEYMRDSDIADVLDLVFWHGDLPFAGLGVLKTPDDPPFCESALAFAASMQRYIEFNLESHPRLCRQYVVWSLTTTYMLTRREVEVVDLIGHGLTNQDIADQLEIGLGTVKTHILRVFQKLEVGNRTALLARVGKISEAATSRHARDFPIITLM